MNAVSPSHLAVLALLAAPLPAYSQSIPTHGDETCVAHIPEAARRSGLSTEIVQRVMMAESGGNARIVSPKGAMGCMQIMPATWADLSARYNLGADPFDARRNMIGGAMYLAELAGRYGMTGALAAYNAGPGRYERYAAGRAVLPAETVAYAARIGVGGGAPSDRPIIARWQEASLFMPSATRGASQPDGDAMTPSRAMPDGIFPLDRGSRRSADASAER